MSIEELVAVIALVCGRGFSDKTETCRETINNCSVELNGVIRRENVEMCVERARREYEKVEIR